jgi:cytochrome c5
MMRIWISTLLLCGAVAMFAQSKSGTPAAKKPAAASQNEGERLFEVNCGRCHHPPEQLSPKITGSVLRHMRVRAMLSKEDEQTILKYLAP